jgi:short-subunit dehydrogenase
MGKRKVHPLCLVLGISLGALLARRAARKRRLAQQEGLYAGKVAVITGASRGIGRGLALELARRGAHVALAARSEEGLCETAALCRSVDPACQTLIIPTDVTVAAQLARLVGQIEAHFGRIDLLFCNAGVGYSGEFARLDDARWRRLMDVNLISAMQLTRLALPGMLARGSGAVVLISSVIGRHALPYMAPYAASKHGLAGFGDALRRELKGAGIHVMPVFPGFADTAMVSAENRRMLHRFGVAIMPVEKVAQQTLDALALRQPHASIGGVERLAVWIDRFAPRLADWAWRRLQPPEFRAAAARIEQER